MGRERERHTHTGRDEGDREGGIERGREGGREGERVVTYYVLTHEATVIVIINFGSLI
jgi:hypothetical protein